MLCQASLGASLGAGPVPVCFGPHKAGVVLLTRLGPPPPGPGWGPLPKEPPFAARGPGLVHVPISNEQLI